MMMLRRVLVALLILVCITATAQTNNYQKQWNEIDTLIIKQNLPKTALEEVNVIYKLAVKEKNDAQVIKALIYRISLQENNSEQKPTAVIRLLQTEIANTNNTATKSILYSLIADKYNTYFNNNRWRFYNRSKTTNYTKEDLETWSANDFGDTIAYNYLQSVQSAALLKQTLLAPYDAIIVKGNARKLRPALYDLLMHEALDYFKSGDYYVTKPAYAFELNDDKALSVLPTFINHQFQHKDSASHLLLSLKLFQQLIDFHLNDADKDALVDVDLERIQWVNNNLVSEQKEKNYTATLQHLVDNYSADRVSQAYYLLALQQSDKAASYQPFSDTVNRFGYVKALQIIDNALPKFKRENEGVANMQNLKTQIFSKTISTETEQVNIPNKPFRALVNYKNIDTLFIRIIKNNKENKAFNNWYSNDFDDLVELKSYKAFTQPLPKTNDYQAHSVEIKMDALPVGEYVLLTSSSNRFNDTLDKMSKQQLYVSNISYIKNGNALFVLNRATGKPLENVQVTITRETWNTKKSRNDTTIFKSKTDKGGRVSLAKMEGYGNYSLKFVAKDDSLNLNERQYLYAENRNTTEEKFSEEETEEYEEDNASVFFFTDRSIYRPGQTVYFKGIAITKDVKTELSKLYLPKDSIKVYLKDVNNDEIDSLFFKVNEYASFAGKFQLPQNVLTGEFTIEAEDIDKTNDISFSVEEYKRPKFYVEFEKTKGSYRLNDSVTVTGVAKAYAGNNVDGAKVKFNVNRNARFVYSWLWRGGIRPNAGSKQITNGEIVTDKDGKFKITFIANADEKVDKATDPLFDFSINADVTDINGETRSSNTKITVGYKAIVLNANVPTIAEADSLKQLFISTKNLSDEKEPAIVSVKIYPLQVPQRLIRSRLWQRADQYIMSKEEYIKNFPEDDYADDNNYLNWVVGSPILSAEINTKETDKLTFNPLPIGYYKVEATTKDKYGNEVKDVKYMQLFARTATPFPQYNFSYTINNSAEPEETAQFLTGSMADKIFVVQKVSKPNDKENFSIVEKLKGLHSLNYKATEEDRGNVSISEAFVYNNRVYTNMYNVMVPWSNKALQVSYASYRNKLEPGSKEKWSVTVKGNKGEKVAAELLTSMYDASLDQFKMHSWSEPNVWNLSYGRDQFENGNNFFVSRSQENYRSYTEKSRQLFFAYDRITKNANELASYNYYIKNERKKNGGYLSNAKIGRETRESGELFLMGQIAGVQVDSNDFGEAVVVGYGSAKRKDVTGSVAVVREAMTPQQKIIKIRGLASVQDENTILVVIDDEITTLKYADLNWDNIDHIDVFAKEQATSIYGVKGQNGVIIVTTKGYKSKKKQEPIIPRTNFNETAFFFPNLYADTSGSYTFSFTMPEALTQWKWQTLAHTKDLAFGTNTTTITTQKTLMVQPNAPRFMREGDVMEFTAKISNLSDKELTGQATLELVDATTNTSVDGWFQNSFPNQYFTVAAGQSSVVKFPIQIPFSYNKPLTWRVVARAGNYSDGEENTLPVLTNRMLVTESLPLYLKAGETNKTFTFDKLLSNKSQSLTNESLTIEYTANPIWSAVQALPYLMEYPYECAEQTFNRFYANALAGYVVSQHPRIKTVFEKWTKDSIQSNLEKNQELKQVLLQETPWVLQAENEAQQRKNIALLFDVIKMNKSLDETFQKFQQMQSDNGGFAWFKGGQDNRYITNYILIGIGKLMKLNAVDDEVKDKLQPLYTKALQYLDAQLVNDYNYLLKNKADLTKQQISSTQLQYLYMRSFYGDSSIKNKTAYNYYYKQAKQFWNKQNTYNAALTALALYRKNDKEFATKTILPSIVENATIDTAKGTMYWKQRSTCFWYESPIEHQAMMIQTLSELQYKNVDAAKTWLLLNKQTNNWRTTIATADACYALLNTGNNWLSNNQTVTIKAGNVEVVNTIAQTNEDNALGYIKKRITGDKVEPSLGQINVHVQLSTTTAPSYGSVYWQYFEDLDKITSAATPLSLKKQLFIEKNSDKGKVLEPVNANDELKVGDKIIVRVELRTDRDMEYMHLKDMRAAAMEPVNVLSGYKWQDGLGYYEATKDASTNFFIDNLRKGVYVFEYPLFITHTGTFSVGIATIQCMYAPAFTSHSEGIKISVKE